MKEFLGGRILLHHGDCREVLRTLADNSIDSVVTDPPYHLTSIVNRFGKSQLEHSPNKNLDTIQAGAFKRLSKGFMGRTWDGGDIAQDVLLWAEVLRVLKPGGHMAVFGGTRTAHRMVCAIEDAGFEIRDTLAWVYGSGFAKAHNLKRYPICSCGGGNPLPYIQDEQTSECNMRSMRQADVSAAEYSSEERGEILQHGMQEQGSQEYGAERSESEACNGEQSGLGGRELHRTRQGLSDDSETGSPEGEGEWICARAHTSGGGDVGKVSKGWRGSPSQGSQQSEQRPVEFGDLRESFGSLDDGALRGRGQCPRCGKLKKEFEGFSSALKPSHEPICLARKPLSEKTLAANVLRWGTGAINVDGCRIPSGESTIRDIKTSHGLMHGDKPRTIPTQGGSATSRWPANLVHDGSPEVLEGFPETHVAASGPNRGAMGYRQGTKPQSRERSESSSGSAARFFYTAKADGDDRLGSKHPTVKPLDLIQWLCRLITPPSGIVLDMFAGTGTTGEAAYREGCSAVLIEREDEYLADIERRMGLVKSGTTSRKHAAAKAKSKLEDHGPLFDTQPAATLTQEP